MSDRKTLKQEYKDTPKPMGIYRILNRSNGKCLVGRSVNIPGLFNRERFMLKLGDHRNLPLQEDWKRFGADAFTFEVLEDLEAPDDSPDHNPKEDLVALEELWIEKLSPFGDKGYNKPPKDER